jgi:hypothetical protein
MHAVRIAAILVAIIGYGAAAAAQEDYVILKATGTSGDLVRTPDGSLFGTGGDTGAFAITPDGTYVEVAPALPYGGSVLASDGFFYGVRTGTQLFRFAPGGSVEILYSITNLFREGQFASSLVQGADGALYGVNISGGFAPTRVFRMTPTGVLTTVYEFTNGLGMFTRLTAGRDGNLYGIDSSRIFRVTPGGGFTLLHTIVDDVSDARLLDTADGFYGTTRGIDGRCGTVFHLGLDGSFHTLHRFTPNEGCTSQSTLIEGGDGLLYGTTWSGIFSIARDGTFRLLHTSLSTLSWAGPARYGTRFDSLMQGSDGNFYGMARSGGPGANGVVFRLNAVRSACLNDVRLEWQSNSATGLLYFIGAIKTETPAFLATWFVSASGAAPLFAGVIPALTPARAFGANVEMSPSGTVGLLSILITSDLHVCSAWQTADTGGGSLMPDR